MAGDWIKMRINLDTDPRVIDIAAQLDVPELHVVGMLWKLWAWADVHTLDGNAMRVTGVTLDRFVGVTGFADALRKVGWLEGRDGALTFPRFADHNGQTAKNRAETNKRVAKHRNAKSVTDVTQKALPEKRREEKKVNTRRQVFVPPTLEDVAECWQLENLKGDAEEFFLHYKANGWTQGKSKRLSDWRAAAKLWSSRQPLFEVASRSPGLSQCSSDPAHRPWREVQRA